MKKVSLVAVLDGLNALYSGAGIPIGLSNNSFKSIVQHVKPTKRMPFYGSKFESWIVAANSDMLKKVDGRIYNAE